MAVYSSGIETKRKFILLTYRKMLEGSVSSLTIRELANESGCSSTALYRHFESLEYLIVVASVRFLDEYMMEYGKLIDRELDLLVGYIEGWKLFNKYAFARPDIFWRLFWGQYNRQFSKAIHEYFELFPFSGPEKFSADYYTLLFEHDIYQRDFIILRGAANQNLLTQMDATCFSKINPLIVKGMLLEAVDFSPEKRKLAEQECNGLLSHNMTLINRN